MIFVISYREERRVSDRCDRTIRRIPSNLVMNRVANEEQAAEFFAKQILEEPEAEYANIVYFDWNHMMLSNMKHLYPSGTGIQSPHCFYPEEENDAVIDIQNRERDEKYQKICALTQAKIDFVKGLEDRCRMNYVKHEYPESFYMPTPPKPCPDIEG